MTDAASPLSTSWAQLPVTLSPHWYDHTRIRCIGAAAFTLLGIALCGLSGHLFSKASIRMDQMLLLLGAGVVSLFFASRCWSPSLNDPETALDLRKKAGLEIQGSGMTYALFCSKFKALLSKGILQTSDVTPLLERDVAQLNYPDFVRKHAGENLEHKRALLQALPDTARALLRLKAVQCFAASPAKAKDACDTEILRGKDASELTVDEKALRATDFNTFMSQHTGVVIQVYDPQANQGLKGLFLAEVYRGNSSIEKYLYVFTTEVAQEIRKTLCIWELELFLEGKIPFSKMVWNKTRMEIQATLPFIDASKMGQLREKLALALVQLHFSQNVSAEMDPEALANLGITPDMVGRARDLVRRDCDQLDYLGPGGFHEKYGSGPLRTGMLPQTDKIKSEFIEKLPLIPVAQREAEIWKDVEHVGLEDEIQQIHWQPMPLFSIWKYEKEAFLNFCRTSNQTAAQLRPKILEATKDLSIFELFYFYRELFEVNVLGPTVRRSAEGQDLATLAEEAVPTIEDINRRVVRKQGWEGVVFLDLLPELIDCGLLTPQSPKLRQFLKEFLSRDGAQLDEWEQSSGGLLHQKDWKKLIGVRQIFTTAVMEAFGTVCAEMKQYVEQNNREYFSHNRQEYQTPTSLKSEYDRAQREIRGKNLQLESVRQDHKRSTSILQSALQTLLNQQKELADLEALLKGMGELQQTLRDQIQSLEREFQPLDEQLQKAGTIPEVQSWATKLELLEKLRDQEQRIDAEIGSKTSKATSLFSAIQTQQAGCANYQQTKAKLSNQERELEQEVQRLEAAEETWRLKLIEDEKAFNDRKNKEGLERIRQYHEKKQQALAKFEKVLIPPLKT